MLRLLTTTSGVTYPHLYLHGQLPALCQNCLWALWLLLGTRAIAVAVGRWWWCYVAGQLPQLMHKTTDLITNMVVLVHLKRLL